MGFCRERGTFVGLFFQAVPQKKALRLNGLRCVVGLWDMWDCIHTLYIRIKKRDKNKRPRA